ncbi:MAG: efflux RND transporter periplasmic adaptor subunit [Pseudomonadales bacterium]|nr:efflux RND transporter periplasmic adaptor subunit [Pseudomonadales bacterium]MCP5184675.1 efflux RND transporter periplasmic adaptor subunit [Pseudomonadales bacterium]
MQHTRAFRLRLPWLIAGLISAFQSTARAGEPEQFDCLIEPMVVTQVGSPVQGVIHALLAERGELVERGQPLAFLESSVEKATLEQARMRAGMQSEIRAREADLELAAQSRARMENLFEQKMVPEQQRDEAVAKYQVAEAALKQAKENFTLLQQDLKRSQELLAQRTIRSPVNGVVVEQRAFPGEFVYENPIMTVAQLNPLRVEVVLPARYFGQFDAHATALVKPEIGDGTPLRATVDVVDRTLDNRSGTFGIRLTLPNTDLAIPGGQKCQLEFTSDTGGIASR